MWMVDERMIYNGNNGTTKGRTDFDKVDVFDEWWDSLSDKEKRNVKDLVIARLKTLPPSLKVCLG